MARAELIPSIGLMRGKLSKDSNIYFYVRNGKQYIGHSPQPRAYNPTTNQQRATTDFKSAAAFVKQVMNDPNMKTSYTKQWKAKLPKFSTLRGYIIHCYFKDFCHAGNA